MSVEEVHEIQAATLRELQLFGDSLSDVETEITAKQYLMNCAILAHRQNTIAKIPGFWAVVFDNAATELEAAITRPDFEVVSQALTSLEVTRHEIPADAKPSDMGLDTYGEPRSVTIKFHFKENEWFSDSTLEKRLWYRFGKDGSAGLVSDPVKIHWKDGMDLTEGLTDAAYALWAVQKQTPAQQIDGIVDGAARKQRDEAARKLPEYKTVAQLLEEKDTGAVSFFNFFSYRGRWISASESAVAKEELRAKRAAAAAGQPTGDHDDEDEEEEEDYAEEDVETFPPGHEVAVAIAEDIWPDAIEYFMADTIDSDVDLDEDEDEVDDVEMS